MPTELELKLVCFMFWIISNPIRNRQLIQKYKIEKHLWSDQQVWDFVIFDLIQFFEYLEFSYSIADLCVLKKFNV